MRAKAHARGFGVGGLVRLNSGVSNQSQAFSQATFVMYIAYIENNSRQGGGGGCVLGFHCPRPAHRSAEERKNLFFFSRVVIDVVFSFFYFLFPVCDDDV